MNRPSTSGSALPNVLVGFRSSSPSWAAHTRLPERESDPILEQLHELSDCRYVMAYWIAVIHTGLKEKDEAFEWLGKAFQERSPMLAWAKVDPRLDRLRSDPRFQGLLRGMTFPA
jgi:hypothetical protein